MEDWGSISFVTVASFCGNYFCASLYTAICKSTARMWIKTYKEFERRGILITLTNPLWLKMAQSGVKTDRIDAESWPTGSGWTTYRPYGPSDTF